VKGGGLANLPALLREGEDRSRRSSGPPQIPQGRAIERLRQCYAVIQKTPDKGQNSEGFAGEGPLKGHDPNFLAGPRSGQGRCFTCGWGSSREALRRVQRSS